MKKLITLILSLMCLQLANANGVLIEELYYLLNDEDLTAQVTYNINTQPSYSNPAYQNFSSKNLTVPSQVEFQNKKYAVTSIGDYAFYNCSGLLSISFPDCLTSIGEYAFYDCRGLTSISFPNSLALIGNSAFLGSENIKTVSFNESSPSIGSGAFSECRGLREVNISSLEAWHKIKFPDAYSYFDPTGANPNSYAMNLLIDGKELSGIVTLPSEWTEIHPEEFYGCKAVTEFILPENLTSIGSLAFGYCRGLTSVSLPEGLQSIESYTFYMCSSLASVTFPENLQSIGESAFEGCSSLTSVTLPDGLQSIGAGAFASCSSLTSVSLPDGLTSLGNQCFSGSHLISVILPESITSINRAFSSCLSLTSVVLPKSLTSVGEGFGDSKLNKIISLSLTPPEITYRYAFNGNTTRDAILYVPAEALEKYQNAEVWGNFQNIKPIILVKDLKLSAEKNIISPGTSLQISATFTPEDATDDMFTWSSSDPTVATVDATGTVKALKGGLTTIKAQTIDGSGVEATYMLAVIAGAFDIADFEINTNESIDVPVNLSSYTNKKYSALQFDVTLPEGLQFENAELGEELIAAGFQIKSKAQTTGAIRVIVTPTNNLTGVDYTENLLYIKVKALNSAEPGIEDIQITNAYLSSVDGSDLYLEDSSASVTFKSTIKTISLDPQTQNIILGQSGTITATVQPADAANRQLQWSVSDPTVAELNGNGLEATLKALKLGSVTVTAVSPYDATIKGEATVNVVGTLEINGEKSIIKTTETLQLSATFVEKDEPAEVTWSSSAPQYASVDAATGLVTGVAVGTAIITATSKEYDNITATFEVEVQQILLGDANDNGSVTVADVVTIANFIVKNPVANWCFINADVNKSGDITSSDMTGTINIIAGEEISAAQARRQVQMESSDRLFSDDFKPVEGETFNIGVSLDNVIPYSALQASVIIPEGMTVEGITAGSQASGHNLIYNLTDDGRVEIVLFSLDNEPFIRCNDTLFNLMVTAEKDCGDLHIRNIIASNATAKDYSLSFEGGRNIGNTTDVENIGNGEPAVYAVSSGIEVINAAGMQINIFSVSGEMVASRMATSSVERFSLDKGIYIVTINDRNYKLLI